MSRLSNLAEMLADYAKSEAKRASVEHVAPIHLFAAVRRWQEEKFDAKFPGLAASIRAAIMAEAGASTKAPQIPDDIITLLGEVKEPDDAWKLAERLEELTSGLRNAGRSQHPSSPTDASVEPGAPSGNGPGADPDPLPFAVTEGLVERIASVTGGVDESVMDKVLSAAYAVAATTLGHVPSDLSEKICSAALVEARNLSGGSGLGQLVGEVAHADHPEAGRVGTQLALALVEVAEWAAAMDDTVSEEETNRIDEIRIALRSQLGERLNAESEAITAFEEKFSRLVGMDSVKAEIRRRIDFLVVNKRRAKRGMKHTTQRMHMAFIGNPGTGKTTVARLYGELLHELGLLPTRNFVETDRSGLVGIHVGETDKKTTEVINTADGGVLFVDEAYSLDDGYGNQKGFGEEATNVLVKQMEDRRDRLVVILAGYRDQTMAFMNVNPGLLSRIPTIVDFPDYSDDELMEIATRIAAGRGLIVDDGATAKLRSILAASRAGVGFGNARTVENVLEAAQRSAVNRTSALGNLATEKELRTILAEDLPEIAPVKTKVIGFGPSTYI